MHFPDSFCKRCHGRNDVAEETADFQINYSAVNPEMLELLEGKGYDIAEHKTANPHTQTIGSDVNDPHTGNGSLPRMQ